MTQKQDSKTTVEEIKNQYEEFCKERNWNSYNIRDVILSIMIELGELAEHFQWDGVKGRIELNKKNIKEIKQEYADVFNYMLRLAIELDIDIVLEVTKKLENHNKKYPAENFDKNMDKNIDKVYKMKGLTN